jgi:two-component sensor histidine kinase
MDDAKARDILSLAGTRISSIAEIHEQLHRSGSLTEIDLAEFAVRLTTLLGRHAPEGITLSADIPRILVKARDGTNIGIVLNELITNALRHGFPGGGPGHIRVTGEIRDRRLFLTVTDDGEGLPQDFDPEKSRGLGMRLARSLAKQFGGELRWANAPTSSAFTFDIPV